MFKWLMNFLHGYSENTSIGKPGDGSSEMQGYTRIGEVRKPKSSPPESYWKEEFIGMLHSEYAANVKAVQVGEARRIDCMFNMSWQLELVWEEFPDISFERLVKEGSPLFFKYTYTMGRWNRRQYKIERKANEYRAIAEEVVRLERGE